MNRKLTILGITLLAFGCMAWAAPKAPRAQKATKAARSFVGTVSDDCGAKYAKASAEAAKSVAKCQTGGEKYVLISGKSVYLVEPQDKFAEFPGKRVRVKGTRNGETITVASVEALKPHKMSKKMKTAPVTSNPTSGK